MQDPVFPQTFPFCRLGLWMVAAVGGTAFLTVAAPLSAEETNGVKPTADSAVTEPATGTSTGKTEISGREIFLREWIPNDPRSHGGDGLGPVFNDTSCVACHNLGGSGGGGPASKNVDVLSAFPNGPVPVAKPSLEIPAILAQKQVAVATVEDGKDESRLSAAELKKKRQAELLKMHPGFRSGPSVVLHRFGTDSGYEAWRWKISMVGDNMPARNNLVMSRVAVNSQTAAVPGLSELVQGGNLPLLNPVARRELPPAGNPRGGAPGVVLQTGVPNAGGAETDDVIISGATTFNVTLQDAQVDGDNDDLAAAKRSMMKVGFRTQHQQGHFTLVTTQRNASSIFGAGLIDSIPNEAIEAAAAKKHKGFGNVKGRVSRLSDGKIGRFGWKAQKASLHDFTMTACAFELGLHTPEQKQADVPTQPEYQAPGLDLTQEECVALVGYLKELPAPAVRVPSSPVEEKYVSTGRDLFTSVGCATCHVPKLGQVDGIYSDLLVHNMGLELADIGGYGISDPDVPEETPDDPESTLAAAPVPGAEKAAFVGTPKKIIGATRAEWRTPPLWGVRDSAPYLHDGRASTLDQAIAVHGGEGLKSAQLFFELSHAERLQVLAFLKTLIAPEQLAATK